MAKKISLREYQESVVARLQSSLAGGGGTASKLGIQAGNDLWLVDLQDASEVVAVPDLAPVPLTHYWFRGVANVRGTSNVSEVPAQDTLLVPRCCQCTWHLVQRG